MFKPKHTKLQLTTDTIRVLTHELKGVSGGSLISTVFDKCVTSTCTKSPDASGCKTKFL